MTLHPNLNKFVTTKLEEDLLKQRIIPFGNELWIIGNDNVKWFTYIDSSGVFWYNQIFFRNYLSLFSMEKKQLDKILKSWFEKKIGIPIRNVMRRNSDMSWYLEEMSTKKNKAWSSKNRNGFSYEIVERFLGIEREKKEVLVEDFIFL